MKTPSNEIELLWRAPIFTSNQLLQQYTNQTRCRCNAWKRKSEQNENATASNEVNIVKQNLCYKNRNRYKKKEQEKMRNTHIKGNASWVYNCARMLALLVFLSISCWAMVPVPITDTYRVFSRPNHCKLLYYNQSSMEIDECIRLCRGFFYYCDAFLLDVNGTCNIYSYRPVMSNCSIHPLDVWERL